MHHLKSNITEEDQLIDKLHSIATDITDCKDSTSSTYIKLQEEFFLIDDKLRQLIKEHKCNTNPYFDEFKVYNKKDI